jgi:hypothetical protein
MQAIIHFRIWECYGNAKRTAVAGAEYEEITATCSGAILRVRRRNLLVDDFSVDTALFEQDYTTAASTANNVWEGGYKFIEVCTEFIRDYGKSQRSQVATASAYGEQLVGKASVNLTYLGSTDSTVSECRVRRET